MEALQILRERQEAQETMEAIRKKAKEAGTPVPLEGTPKILELKDKAAKEKLAKERPEEMKQLDFHNKLYLAPLTTVGNLPYRRICKRLGADITIGEMALAQNIVNGQISELALLRRHKSEDFFGVQIAGHHFDAMAKAAEIISNEIDCDFVDINCGCPIDMMYNQGAGSALLDRPNRLFQICRTMSHVLNKPLTVKMRTGVKNSNLVAHTLIPKLKELGAVAFTVHGRTKKQHYYHSVDWPYVEKCAAFAEGTPVFGNGDIFTYAEYEEHTKNSKLAGVMLARGALIKPWLFTEIKERRVWDISSHERFELLKEFCSNGLEHWGSDTQGVNKVRRFLLEWMSFLHRYIPVPLLEVPQKMIHRLPPFIGRDDLETLMGSPLVSDWLKISEMILGKAPEDFHFIPKHKANNAPASEG